VQVVERSTHTTPTKKRPVAKTMELECYSLGCFAT
jgi:hypothetical protein